VITAETLAERREIKAAPSPSTLLLKPAAIESAGQQVRRSDMRPSNLIVALPLLAVLAAGCTTMGTGFGSTATGADHVNFSWKSSNSVSGTMNATLSDGKTYTGQFFQITSDTTVDNLGPLWAGWGPGWRGDWGYWSAGPEFITHYSGRVLANLGTPDGQHMRCKFQLVHPSDGMAGGGHGQCQLPDGKTIDATFPTA
jgi:hypothetical protein